MSDFLNFLNTASLDELTLIPGITRSLAANIIAERPFDFVEDCLKVKGMGKNLLGRAQSYYETAMNNSGNRAMVPVEGGDSVPVPDPREKPPFWTRLGEIFSNFLRSLLRLAIILAVIGVVGAALYFGLPFINEKFMAPVEQNTAQIDQLEAEISALQEQVDEMNGRVDALEGSIATHTESLDRLKVVQDALEEKLQENNSELLLDLKHEVMMTRALDMLGRARLYLAQSNFGSARADIRSARELLAQLHAETNDEILEQGINRLDLALGNLPAFPVVAAGDLEIAWQLLITGKPPTEPEAVPTFSPTATPTLQITPTP
jgi:prefoldin subunit 5